MKRRESIKAIALTAISSGVLLQSCDTNEKEKPADTPKTSGIDRHPFEQVRDEKLLTEKFFDDHEMNTIKVLIDIIIPKDETSGSATDAGVHDFIEFIAKDMPRHQLPLRGGIKWIDVQCLKQHNKTFVDCSSDQQLTLVDEIAYPQKAKPEMKQGVTFFNLLRDLTATGFFTSQMGLKDLGYAGNTPNQWDGVPEEVLLQYGYRYSERELNESVKFNNT
ncbi:gluconate 2-dehydrogenase subunit 3 family protein [Oscillatoria amoena NRMC-F 0135]|nr:gluconate 2-dehydrogenase subunit 3 family protein [Oscillatoria amoena NRMC-F 0135]